MSLPWSCIPNTIPLHTSTSPELKALNTFASYCNIVSWPIPRWNNHIFKLTNFYIKISNCPSSNNSKLQQQHKERFRKQNNIKIFFSLDLLNFLNTLGSRFELCFWEMKSFFNIQRHQNYPEHTANSIRNICLFQEGNQKTCPSRKTSWEMVCGSIQKNHNRINNKIMTMTQ